jgi:hypothetical protein
MTMTALLDRIDERSTEVQTKERQSEFVPERSSKARRRRLVPALAGALAVLVIAAGVWAITRSDEPDSAGLSPLEVTDQWNEAVVAGDWAAIRALYADTAVLRVVLPDETLPDEPLIDRVPQTQDDWDGDGALTGFDGFMHDGAAQHAAGTTTFLSCSQVDGTTVTCEEVQEGHAFWRPEAVPTTWTLTIIDGLITVHGVGVVPRSESPIDNALLSDYRRWVSENRPELEADLIEGPVIPPIPGINITPDTAPIHRELVAEWQAGR